MGGSATLWPLELWAGSSLHGFGVGSLVGGKSLLVSSQVSGGLLLNAKAGWGRLVGWSGSGLWAVLSLWLVLLLGNVLRGRSLTNDLLWLVWLGRLLSPLWDWETALRSLRPWLGWEVGRSRGGGDSAGSWGLGVLLLSLSMLGSGGSGELLLSGGLLSLSLSMLDLPVVLRWLSVSWLGMNLGLVLRGSWGSLGAVAVLRTGLGKSGAGEGTAVLNGTSSGGTTPLSGLWNLTTVVLGGGNTGDSGQSL